MNKDFYTLSLSKYILVKKIIENTDNKKLFDRYDYLIVSKCFDIAKELSTTENILTLSSINLKPQEINIILANFIKTPITKNFSDKRCLYEVAKVSNKLANGVEKQLSLHLLQHLLQKLQDVSHETNLFSVDFTILRILDNFILKLKGSTIKNQYNSLKKDILRKMLKFNYIVENKEKQTTYLCWPDRFLTAILNQEISLSDFIKINTVIMSVATNNLELNWKILNIVKYLCFQPHYDDVNILRKFKRDLIKNIEEKYKIINFDKQKVENVLIYTLAELTTKKESFYYLFDVIKILAQKSDVDKIFCLNLCEYLIYISKKQNIFSYRFIREYFLTMLFDFFKEEDSAVVKEKELQILIQLFHYDLFFCLHKQDIFEKIISILFSINKDNQISRNKFYKYCDIIDYMAANNDDIFSFNIIKKISINKDDEHKISKHFQLTLSNQKVLNTA